MTLFIYPQGFSWIENDANVRELAAAGFTEWDDDSLLALLENEIGTPAEDREEAIEDLARRFSDAYKAMRDYLSQGSGAAWFSGVRLADVQFEHDEWLYDEVSILWNYQAYGSLPVGLDPALQFSEAGYSRPSDHSTGRIANASSNPYLVEAFKHTALTHPDAAVRAAMVADGLLAFTADELRTLAEDPSADVQAAVSARTIAAAG